MRKVSRGVRGVRLAIIEAALTGGIVGGRGCREQQEQGADELAGRGWSEG